MASVRDQISEMLYNAVSVAMNKSVAELSDSTQLVADLGAKSANLVRIISVIEDDLITQGILLEISGGLAKHAVDCRTQIVFAQTFEKRNVLVDLGSQLGVVAEVSGLFQIVLGMVQIGTELLPGPLPGCERKFAILPRNAATFCQPQKGVTAKL